MTLESRRITLRERANKNSLRHAENDMTLESRRITLQERANNLLILEATLKMT